MDLFFRLRIKSGRTDHGRLPWDPLQALSGQKILLSATVTCHTGVLEIRQREIWQHRWKSGNAVGNLATTFLTYFFVGNPATNYLMKFFWRLDFSIVEKLYLSNNELLTKLSS